MTSPAVDRDRGLDRHGDQVEHGDALSTASRPIRRARPSRASGLPTPRRRASPTTRTRLGVCMILAALAVTVLAALPYFGAGRTRHPTRRATPVSARQLDDMFLIPLTFGNKSGASEARYEAVLRRALAHRRGETPSAEVSAGATARMDTTNETIKYQLMWTDWWRRLWSPRRERSVDTARCPECREPVVVIEASTSVSSPSGPMFSPPTRAEALAACARHGRPPFNERTIAFLAARASRPPNAR